MAVTSFKSKIVKSVLYSTAQFTARFGLQLVSIVVLARLLSPEIYGVFAIVLVFTYLLEMLSEMGLRSLILTKEGDVPPEMLQTCWTLQILRSFIVFGVVLIIAAVIWALQTWGVFAADSAYNAPVLPLALIGVGGSQMILALTPTTPYMYERSMQFGHVTLTIVLASSIGLAVTIGVAWFYPSVWALVIGTATQRTVTMIYSFLAFKGVRMRVCWDADTLRLAVDRGKWLWGHSALTAVTNGADRLLVGLLMDSSTFGFYFIARRIVGFCGDFLNMVDARMGLQVFRHILQADAETFRRNYYRYRLLFDALAGTGAGALLILAPKIVEIVFDDRYAGVAPFIQILCFGLMLAGPLVLRSAFSAERRFKRMTVLSIVTALTIWCGLLAALFVFESIEMAVWVIALYRLPEALLLFRMSSERDWFMPIRETLPLSFFTVGAGIGWGALSIIDQFI